MQAYNTSRLRMRSPCVILRWALAFALLFGAMAAQAAITITRTSSPVFYIDTGITPSLTGMYASYQITGTTNVAAPGCARRASLEAWWDWARTRTVSCTWAS